MGSMCEPLDLSHFAQHDMWYQQLVFEGFQSGVPTNTTPTLTPTTLRTLEQSLISMEADDTSYHNEAGFVPPIVQPTNAAGSICLNVMNPATLQGGSTTVIPSMANNILRPSVVTSTMNTSPDNTMLVQPMTSAASTSTVRKNVGGRRPTKAQGISPEEEERRQLRRERNKAAAARCRKRRMDQTTSLEGETKGLEDKRMQLQQEIRELTLKKEELKLVLEEHKRTGCKMVGAGVNGVGMPCDRASPCGRASPPDIKPIVVSSGHGGVLPKPGCLIKQEVNMVDPLCMGDQYMNSQFGAASAPPPKRTCFGPGSANGNKPPRPTSLNVAAAFTPAPSNMRNPNNLSEVAGIPISTPSAGMFNFDSLMEGGTGLTPVSGPLVPSCSSQQRNHNSVGDLSSPDSNMSNKLVSL